MSESQTIQYAPSNHGTALADRVAAVLLQVFPRVLGALLVWYGIRKLAAPESMHVVLAYDGFTAAWIQPIAYAVIGFEIALGLMLLAFCCLRKTVITLAIVALAVYTAQLGYLLTGADAPPCNCGGEQVLPDADSIRHANLMGIIRNILLIVPSAWVLLQLYLSKPATPSPGNVGLPSDNH